MRSASLMVAAALTVGSLAAENIRPRFYFPRHVNRQFTFPNASTTSTTSGGSSTTASEEEPSSPLIVLPSDILDPIIGSPTATGNDNNNTTSTSTSVTITPTRSSSASPTSTESPDLGDIISSILNGDETTKSSTTTGTTTATETETSTSSDGLGLTLLPTLGTTTTTEASTTASATASTSVADSVNGTSTSSGLLDITLPTLLPTIFTPTTSAEVPTTTEGPNTVSTTAGNVNATSSDSLGITLPTLLPTIFTPTSASATEPTSEPVSTSSGINLTSLLPTIVPTPTPIVNGTQSSTVVPPTDSVTIPTIVPTSSGLMPTSSDVVSTPSISLPATVPSSSALPPITNIPGNSTTASETLPPVTTPTASISLPPIGNATTAVSSTDEPPLSTPSPTTLAPTTTLSTPTFTGTSVTPTGTITDSESWLPTTILVQPSTTTMSTGGLPTSATGIPSDLPQALSPFNEAPQQPDGTSLIQISFQYGVNYQFLVGQPMAAAQLFQHLPEALAFAGGFDKSKSVMHSIVPYDTINTLGYITSQALVYHPTDQIAKLQVDVRTPSSKLYNNPQAIVYNLTAEINPAIDIILGSLYGGASGTGGNGGPFPTDTGASNNEPFSSGNTGDNTSGSQKAQTAGIAVGAAAVASAYGAAMFIIARRYKRKRQGHKRNSSISSNAEMRQAGSPAMMGGALLSRDFTGYGGVQGNTRHSQGSGRSGGNNSARTAIISAPVAAENSLGWN